MAYLAGFFGALLGSGTILRWVQILAFAFLGLGLVADWTKNRDAINSALGAPLMPDALNWQLLMIAFLTSIVIRLLHNEALRHSRSARICFEPAFVSRNITLFHNGHANGLFDKASVRVRNVPFRGDSGTNVEHAWASAVFFNQATGHHRTVEFLRWQENEKPGYSGNPDRIIDEWKHRDLRYNQSPHTLNIVIKHHGEDAAYPMTVMNQTMPSWRDTDAALEPGTYVVRLTIFGSGLRTQTERFFLLENPGGSGQMMLSDTEKRWVPE